MKRQQIKILNAIQNHHKAMKSLSKNGDHRLQILISDYLKPKSNMTKHTLSDVEKFKLLKRPGPYTPDPACFHFGQTLESYREFIEDHEKKRCEFDEQHGIV